MPTDSPTAANAPESPVVGAARGSALAIVFLVVFIDLLGFGIVLPLLPRYAERYLGGFSELGKGAMIGALYSSFSLMQFVFSPVWGRVSDRIGRRPVLLVSLAGSVVFYALFGYASTVSLDMPALALGLLLASRVGAGIAGASVGTASAVIADSTTPEKRSKGMALIGAAFGIGFTFGPLIAYAALNFLEGQPWAPGAAASALSAAAFVVALFALPETLKPGPKPPREFFSVGRSLGVLKMPRVGALILVYFLAIFAFANFEGTLALFTKDAFRMGDDDAFLVFAFIGLVLMVVQGGIYRPLAGRRSEESLLALGLLLMLAGLAGITANAVGAWMLKEGASDGTAAAGPSLQPFFYFSVAVAVAGFAFVNPSVTGLLSRRADPARQGEILGVNQSFSALGRILGPVVGSLAFYAHPSRVAPYAVAALVLLGVAALVPGLRRSAGAAA